MNTSVYIVQFENTRQFTVTKQLNKIKQLLIKISNLVALKMCYYTAAILFAYKINMLEHSIVYFHI